MVFLPKILKYTMVQKSKLHKKVLEISQCHRFISFLQLPINIINFEVIFPVFFTKINIQQIYAFHPPFSHKRENASVIL